MNKLLEKMKPILCKAKAAFEKVKSLLINMKHKKLIAGIGAGVLVLAIALIILLSGMQSAPLTPAQQYIKLETDLLHKLVNSIPDEVPEVVPVQSIDILPGDALLSLLGMEDAQWAERLSVKLVAKQKEGLQEALWDFKLNGNDLFSATTIADPVSGITYLVVPSVSEHYLKIDKNTAGTENGSEIIGSVSAVTDFLAMLNISEADVAKSIINKYIDVFFSHMTEVEKASQVLNLGNKTQTADVYTNYITEKVFTDAFRGVLTEARNDVALKAVFPADMDYEDVIDTMLSNLNEEPTNDREDAIVLKLYVDSENRLLGRDLLLPDMTASCITVTGKNGTAFKISYSGEDMGYEFMIDGEGKGTLSMVQPDQTVILANLTYSGTKESGICEITLSDFFENLIFQDANVDPKLEIKWSTNNPMSFGFSMNGERFVTIETSSSTMEGPHDSITIPEASFDYNVPEEYEQYLESVDWSLLRTNMLEAGVPENIVNFLLGKE